MRRISKRTRTILLLGGLAVWLLALAGPAGAVATNFYRHSPEIPTMEDLVRWVLALARLLVAG